ncbi:MAG: hypothetical protein ACFB6R_15400 [Alphaproteobacteria bacterium]
MSLEALIITLVVGAIGGNLAGMVLPARSLGWLWNTVVGVLGGGIGFFVLGLLGLLGATLLGSIAASFIGGAVLLFIISLLRKA